MKRVLIVDDSKDARAKFRKWMMRSDFSIDEVTDGESAFHYCMQRKPDIIFLDYDMPNMDGIAFLKLYQDTLGQHQKMPQIIFLTDDFTSPIATEAKNLGATLCLQVPCTAQKIKQCLKNMGI